MNDERLKALQRIQKANGGILTTEKVLAAARDDASPLHAYFLWDDTEAAHLYRTEQANRLIRSFHVRVKEVARQGHSYTIEVFTPDPAVPRGYRSTHDLLAGPEGKSALMQEHGRCWGHVERYLGYLREVGLSAAADHLERAMRNAQAAVAKLRPAEAGA